MSKVLVLYYSTYGHIETMAQAVAEGARSTGASVDVKRVAETVAQEVAKAGHFKLEQAAPVATVADSKNTTPSSLAAQPVLDACLRKWPAFWIRRVACGLAGRSMARSEGRLRPRPRNTEVRK